MRVVDKMVVVSFKISSSLRVSLNTAASKLDESEGHFIRVAVAERLKALKYDVPEDAMRRPTRKGVGGKPTHKKSGSVSVDPSVPGGPFRYEVAGESPVKGSFSGSSTDTATVDQDTIRSAAHVVVVGSLGAVQKRGKKRVSVRSRGSDHPPDLEKEN